MADVIHLVIRIHQHRKQPEEKQHLRRLLSDHPLRQVQPGGLAVRFHLNLQTLLRIHQIQIVPLILTPPRHRVQQLPVSVELPHQPILPNGRKQYLPLTYR